MVVGVGGRVLGARMLHGKNWKQKTYGRYVAEFPDSAVLEWSVHSCLLRDSRKVCHLFCVLMGQIYKRMSLLSKKLTFLSGKEIEYKYL